VLVVTVKEPSPLTDAQLTANEVEAVPPAGTFTVWEFPPLTEQFPATPDRATVWLPAGSAVNVTLPFVPIG